MAFAGPSYKKNVTPEGYCTLAPSDYIPYFTSKNVGLVVRLNKKNYNEQDFIKAGIQHLDQFYLDGSCPPMTILQTVLQAFESLPPNKAFAVHCKAGLGRTGTCIGAYMMKHYRMTAPEVISWMRICRPGCVIGPQQQFLQDLEPIMWQEGDMMRLEKGIPFPSGMGDTMDTTSSGKKRSSTSKSKKVVTPTAAAAYPDTTVAADSETTKGRPGQAEALLASRRQRQAAATTTKGKGPVPVTPDGTSASKEPRSFTSGGEEKDRS